MSNKLKINLLVVALVASTTACKLPQVGRRTESRTVPPSYSASRDSLNTADTKWNDLFKDQNLKALIDTALKNNQELNIVMQEINISKNEIRARKGAYLPMAGIVAGAGIEKSGRYTLPGVVEANNDIEPGKKFPEPLPDMLIGANISWEVDIWKKLRNSKKAAVYKYLSTVEGKNFMVTQLVSEIANSYYELMALDNQLEILKKNIEVQQNALEIVKLEKIAAKVTELAVRRFEAEVLKNQSRQFYIMQQITETENRINFLVGRFPQTVARNSSGFTELVTDSIHAGIPSQLLSNRTDIRQAEQSLLAAKLDVKAAKAEFYPSFRITAGAGLQAFNPTYLLKAPESLICALAGELVAPLINRNAIKANYYSANSKQIQAVYNYERTVLRAHIEVVNQLSNISNLKKSYDLKNKQVEALTKSIEISTGLFKNARADYMEVLLTQRDAMESKFELIETKKQQMNAMVNIYQALGGGWK
ncbi:MAG: TolC family protein [Bacteroidia bacterium]|nr:TolC family protein [Bacteroidia bacterium]